VTDFFKYTNLIIGVVVHSDDVVGIIFKDKGKLLACDTFSKHNFIHGMPTIEIRNQPVKVQQAQKC
jgi:hypothetical protein